jgi:putative hydrolase of the HAD superfamily
VSPLARPRAVLLDLDDTIIDDSSATHSGWATACAEAVPSLGSLEAEALQASIFEVRDWYWSDAERHRLGRQDLRAAGAWIVGEALSRHGVADPPLAAAIANRYRDIRDESLCLFEGAIETLDHLRSRGATLALLTNGGAAGQRAKIERFGLAPYFDFICIEGEFGWGKPDERVYSAALTALGVAATDAWMAGDNIEWDVAAPMRLGLSGIWVDRHAAGLPSASSVNPDGAAGRTAPLTVKPDAIVLSIAELRDL